MTQQKYSRRNRGFHLRHGFTLIELLIVMAIIALLAAILFPVFARARENARKASCLSNLKQLGLGFTQYLQDYDGRFPGAAQLQKWENGAHWVKGTNNQALTDGAGNYVAGRTADVTNGAIFPYVKSSQIYICPSNTDARQKLLSYTMNCAINGAMDASISESSSVILLDDEAANNDGYFYAVNNPNSTDQMTKIHNGGGNLLFCDGHAKFYQFNAFPVNNANGTLKARTSGQPRFYDLGLGGSGYYDASAMGFGTCPSP
jgi:prepilin-type N-terminal cleavage/methylation domain-containing protein/prepilin-type processing-associated H-X9-DG protein